MFDHVQYYTPDRIDCIKKSQDYQDLLLVAMDILEDINDDYAPRPIAMVCGPISTGGTGSRRQNLYIFSKVIERVTTDGLIVFNQMPFENDIDRIYNLNTDLPRIKLLEEFYGPIFRSGFISLLLFIPGWAGSVGAKWENEQAKILGIPRLYLAQSYMLD